MAFTPYHNITGSTGVDVQLIAPGDNNLGISSIYITNKNQAGTPATVSLFIQDQPAAGTATSKFTLLHEIQMVGGTSLLLDDKSLLSYDGIRYGLYTTVATDANVDIFINR